MEERLKKIREVLNMSQREFAEKINIGQSTLGMMEVGKRAINERHIQLICLQFNVNEIWLRTGEGSIFNETTASIISDLTKQYNLDELDQLLILEYAKLSLENRKAIKKYIDNIRSGL